MKIAKNTLQSRLSVISSREKRNKEIIWSRSNIESAKRFAPILNEQAKELKIMLSGEAYKQLNRDSVCHLKAMDVRTDE
ncbi:hypothetical protein Bca4012_026761 [Brassica carinata]